MSNVLRQILHYTHARILSIDHVVEIWQELIIQNLFEIKFKKLHLGWSFFAQKFA